MGVRDPSLPQPPRREIRSAWTFSCSNAKRARKRINRNKIQEISGAPLTEQTIVVVTLFPFAGRGWMQKKPFERVFQTLIRVLTGTADWEPRAGDPYGPGHRYVWIGVGPYSDLSCEPE